MPHTCFIPNFSSFIFVEKKIPPKYVYRHHMWSSPLLHPDLLFIVYCNKESPAYYRKVSKISRGLFQNFFFTTSAYFRGRLIIEVGLFQFFFHDLGLFSRSVAYSEVIIQSCQSVMQNALKTAYLRFVWKSMSEVPL